MKRIALIFLCLLLLSGCASLAPDEYLSITPHQSSEVPTAADAVTAKDYQSLKNAILAQIRSGQTECAIRVTSYDGVVEDDLRDAAYEVSKLDPLGAYAVDYMTHSCTRIVSYYEIRIFITFRRTAQEIAQIHPISTQEQLQDKIEQALDRQDSRLTLRLASYRQQDQDIPGLAADYCEGNAASIMETPQVSVSVYPETGSSRILEVNFLYTNTPQELQQKQAAVEESLHAAAEYIRYRQGDYDKAQLLYSYLTQRFQYKEAETATPLYDALCGGIADPKGLSQAWQLICDRAGMECNTVTGMRGDEVYTWNILRMGTYYRHLDLARCVLDRSGLVLRTDAEMGNYYWNTELLPACEFVPAPEQEPPQPDQPAPEEDPLAPELPVEIPPADTPVPELPKEDLPNVLPPSGIPEEPPEDQTETQSQL